MIAPKSACAGKWGFPAEEGCCLLEVGQIWFFQSVDFGLTAFHHQPLGCYWELNLEMLSVSWVMWLQPSNLGAASWDFSWKVSLTRCYLHMFLQWMLFTADLNPVLICDCQNCVCIVEVCGTPFHPSRCLSVFLFEMGRSELSMWGGTGLFQASKS